MSNQFNPTGPILVTALKEKVYRELYDQLMEGIIEKARKEVSKIVSTVVDELNITADAYYQPHNLRQEVHFILHEGKDG